MLNPPLHVQQATVNEDTFLRGNRNQGRTPIRAQRIALDPADGVQQILNVVPL